MLMRKKENNITKDSRELQQQEAKSNKPGRGGRRHVQDHLTPPCLLIHSWVVVLNAITEMVYTMRMVVPTAMGLRTEEVVCCTAGKSLFAVLCNANITNSTIKVILNSKERIFIYV